VKHPGDNSALEAVSTKQERIAYRAKHHPQEAFTSLGHNLTGPWLQTACHRTRKDGAVGIDGTTSQEYAKSLDENLERLSEQARSGWYQAPPVRRGYVPKPGKREARPIGIPAFEDKVLQRAVAMILEPIYEQDFLDCSYGFRPGRSAHQALEAIWQQHRSLNRKLSGHYSYFGITGNMRMLNRAYQLTQRNWCKWLRRRTRANRGITWERFGVLTKTCFPLATPRIVHSYG
jgi:hypothetical protein